VINLQKLGNFGLSVVIGSKFGGKLENCGLSPSGRADFTPEELSIRRGVSSGTNGVCKGGSVVEGTAVVVVGTSVVVGAGEVEATGSVAKAGKMPRLGVCDGTGCTGLFVGKAT
jgi:hypothetical protein